MTTIAVAAVSATKPAGLRVRIDDTLRILDGACADVCLLPGGWFCAGRAKARKLISQLEDRLAPEVGDRLLCFGVDGRKARPWPKDQLTVAMSAAGIQGIARKFHAAPGERGVADTATDYRSPEAGFSRIVNHAGRSWYLAVCYDCFGIRHQRLTNPRVDAILTTVHGFYPPGQPNSGATYFARHGVAGASKAWGVPAFASTVFFDKSVPDRWPTGIRWDQGGRSTTAWHYADNPLLPERTNTLALDAGCCRIDTYRI